VYFVGRQQDIRKVSKRKQKQKKLDLAWRCEQWKAEELSRERTMPPPFLTHPQPFGVYSEAKNRQTPRRRRRRRRPTTCFSVGGPIRW
jgi:hypothetical protein